MGGGPLGGLSQGGNNFSSVHFYIWLRLEIDAFEKADMGKVI